MMPRLHTHFRLLSATLLAWSCFALSEERKAPVRGQDITIIAGEERTIYEYRQNGVLRQIKVVPSIGRPYYLVSADETRGFGDLEQASRLVPRWTIIEF